jgi:hypothetical protein
MKQAMAILFKNILPPRNKLKQSTFIYHMVRFIKLFLMFYKFDSFKRSLIKAWVCRRASFLDKPKKDFFEDEIYPND